MREENKVEDLEKLVPAIKKAQNSLEHLYLEHETFLKASKGRFNVFTTLLKEGDEVRLHSRFIAHLLDPKANHDCGRLFLDLFLDTISEGIQLHNDDKSVELEILETLKNLKQQKCSMVRKEFGNIDIYIEFENHIIAIENKIWAGEQYNQISRYIELIENKKKSYTMLYLTLDGKESETHNGKNYFRISYRDNILSWLERCLQKTYQFVNINQALLQYKKIISKLTGNNTNTMDMAKVEEIVENNPEIIKYIQYHREIEETKYVIMVKKLDELFSKINEKLNNKFNTEWDWKAPDKKIDNKAAWFARKFNTCIQSDVPIYIEYSALYNTLYIGTACITQDKKEKLKSKLIKLKECIEIQYMETLNSDDSWISGRYILYENLFTDNYLVDIMINKTKLQEDANKIASKIEKYIETVKKYWKEINV